MTNTGIRTFHFGEFSVDPESNSLLKNGRECGRLEPRQIELLCFFAQNQGQVLSRELIAKQVWQGTVVGDEAINKTVFSLRAALNDDAKNPTYIETIPKRGYRFLADVSVEKKHFSHKFKALVFSSVILALGILVYSLSFPGVNGDHSWTIDSIERVTALEGKEGGLVFNPSRTKMAFVRLLNGRSDIFVQNMDGTELEQHSNNDYHEGSLIWLNDNSLLYKRCKSNKCQIVRHTELKIDVLYETNDSIPSMTSEIDINQNLYFSQLVTPTSAEIFSLNLVSSEVTALRSKNKNLPKISGYLSLSSALNTLYFVDYRSDSKNILALNLKDNELRLVSNEFTRVRNILTENESLIVSGIHDNREGIFRVEFTGPAIKPVLFGSDGETLWLSSYDPENGILYYENSKLRRELWSQNVSGLKQRLPMHSESDVYNAIFYGDDIVFASDKNGFNNYWKFDSAANLSHVLTDLRTWALGRPVLNSDRTLLAFVSITDKSEIHIKNLKTNSSEVAYAGKEFYSVFAWNAASSKLLLRDAHGVLYSMTVNTGEIEVVAENVGNFATFFGEQEEIFFIDREHQKFYLKKLDDSHVILEFERPLANLNVGDVKLDNSHLYIKLAHASILAEYSIDLENRRSSLVSEKFRLVEEANVSDISPDGTTVLFSVPVKPTGNILKIQFSK